MNISSRYTCTNLLRKSQNIVVINCWNVEGALQSPIFFLHHLTLKGAKYSRECCFCNILWSYACLLISPCHIQLGSENSLCYIMTYCVLIWERCHLLPCISFCCCRSNTVLNVPFFFGIHSIGIACFAAAGIHHPGVVYHSIF